MSTILGWLVLILGITAIMIAPWYRDNKSPLHGRSWNEVKMIGRLFLGGISLIVAAALLLNM